MRHAPTLTFVADALPESARHVDEVLARAKALTRRPPPGASSVRREADPTRSARARDDAAHRSRLAVTPRPAWSSSTSRLG
jgi:ribosome-binding factor A